MYLSIMPDQLNFHKDHNYASLNSNEEYENEITSLYSL